MKLPVLLLQECHRKTPKPSSPQPPPPPQTKKRAFHLISTTHHQAYGLLAKSLRPTQNVDITKDICSMADN